jgi:hypothetical protein
MIIPNKTQQTRVGKLLRKNAGEVPVIFLWSGWSFPCHKKSLGCRQFAFPDKLTILVRNGGFKERKYAFSMACS